MAALVIEDMIPVRYESWQDWREQKIADAHERRSAPVVEPDSAPCGYCWGQRRILGPAPNGEGLIPQICVPCAGTGRVFNR
jgi:hypothetical protein